MTDPDRTLADNPAPDVSVVIPTRNRSELIARSVGSALSQAFELIEVLVVIDGPDPATILALESIADGRLRVIPLSVPVGGAEARNVGVRRARGRWVAFLDDDDEWLPSKLEKQLGAAANSRSPSPVICSAYVARSSEGDKVFGYRVPTRTEAISEYMFARRGFAYGENALATSVLVAPRALLLEVPFDPKLRRHQDWDWALRALSRADTELVHVSEPLSIYYMPEGATRVSGHADWRYSFDWCRRNRQYFTPKAASFFIATECITRARQSHATFRDIMSLLQAVLQEGELNLHMVLQTLWCLAAPRDLRRGLLRLKSKLRT